MFSSYFILGFTLLFVSFTSATFKNDNERCGCTSSCETKYCDLTNTALEEKAACQKGCRLFRLIVRIPHKNAMKTSKDHVLDNCASSCMDTLLEKHQMDACLEGCQNGCDYLSFQPRVKLTILVDEPNAASVDLEPLLLDPGLKHQLDEAMHGQVKPKIPASYFTNLPVTHKSEHGCHTEFRLCEAWLISEPLICALLLVVAVMLLFAAFWRRPKPKHLMSSDQAPMLPEKIALQLPV